MCFNKVRATIKDARFRLIPLIFLLIFGSLLANGQSVLISDKSGDTTGHASALLELKSNSKGFLPPRLSQAERLAITAPAEGLLVFQNDGVKGLYYYKDSAWTYLTDAGAGYEAPIFKNVSDTLEKNERLILAGNDIVLTLPAITSADNGLSFTIKNIGSHVDLVSIAASGGALIDSASSVPLPVLFATTVVAHEGNWYFKQRTSFQTDVLEVSWHSGWKTIQQALEFLNEHMWAPSLIRLGAGTYEIDETQIINLPYPVTFQGASFGLTYIVPTSNLAGKPMFVAETEAYFKMIAFDATPVPGYGNSTGEDAIQLAGAGTYYEVKDATFDGFQCAIKINNNVELWLFEADIYNCKSAGVDIAAGAGKDVSFKISEVDFYSCANGVNLKSGSQATISIINCGFYNDSTSVGINYDPANFTSIKNIAISSNTWNTNGDFIKGFDFTRADGRDRNVIVVNNAGSASQTPRCVVSVLNNTTSVSVGSTWTKAVWNSATQTNAPLKFTVANNRITYQPSNHRDIMMWITGNAQASGNNKVLNVAIVKNGNSSLRYGETTVRLNTGSQPYQWATAVFLNDVGPNDYFEIWISTPYTETFILQDVNWLTTTQ